MKSKLTAIGYTLFLTVSVLASPVFMEWYVTEILGREYLFENMPAGVILLTVFLFIAQMVLAIYLWTKVFDNEKQPTE